jgi:uncharacterized protein (DUF2147 family)
LIHPRRWHADNHFAFPSRETAGEIMRYRLFPAAAFATTLLASATVARAADPTGTWLNDEKDAIIQIADCAMPVPLPGTPSQRNAAPPPPSGLLCGTVVWLRNPVDPATGGPQTDKNNKDPARRGRQILGMRGVTDMRPSSTAGKWDGRVYDIDGGKTYDGNLILKGENELRVQGCVMLMCQGETWTRTAPPAAAPRQRDR